MTDLSSADEVRPAPSDGLRAAPRSNQEKVHTVEETHDATGSDDLEVNAPSQDVFSRRQRLSDIFTIVCAGFALISDGYQNNLM